MGIQVLEQETRQQVAVVEIGPLSGELIRELDRASDAAEEARNGAVIVLRVRASENPRAVAHVDTHLLTQWERALRRVERGPGITVGTAESDCGWAEWSALLVTDFRIAAPHVQFTLADPGNLPSMAIHRLANQIGIARTRRLALFDGHFSARRAASIGLIDEVTHQVEDRLAEFLDSIRDRDSSDLAVRRQLLLEAPSRSYEDALGTHLAACDRALRRRARGIRP